MALRQKQSGPFLEAVIMRGCEKVAELISWRVLRLCTAERTGTILVVRHYHRWRCIILVTSERLLHIPFLLLFMLQDFIWLICYMPTLSRPAVFAGAPQNSLRDSRCLCAQACGKTVYMADASGMRSFHRSLQIRALACSLHGLTLDNANGLS